jgi:hypothetical protein
MDVYLIPVGPDRYEPYCEVDDEAPHADDPGPGRRGWLASLHVRFREMLAAAEHERVHHPDGHPPTRSGRLRARIMRWVAERIAEQRLLWHLRRQHAATLLHPSDLDGARAHQILLTALQRDGDRHLRWLIVNAGLLAVSSVLTLIPGPNVIWWYFAFRVVGHYFSWRGARHGALAVSWTLHASEALADLRRAIALDPDERRERVIDIASRLQLQHLASFFQRMALWSA